jgi:hypothetical protein
MGVWYNLTLGKYKTKYTPLSVEENEYESCDENGNVLKRVSGSYTKGYYIDEKTGTKHDKAFKLVNGKATDEFKGRIKEVESYSEIPSEEFEDILTEKTFLVECESLFNDLKEKGKCAKFGGWFGTGYKAYRVYVSPSQLYKGFLIMKAGRGQVSELIGDLVGDLEEIKEKKKIMDSITATSQKVNKAKVEEMIRI